VLGQARVESDSKDKSLAITRCNGAPILRGVEAMQKTITIVSRKEVQFRRKTARYGKGVGTMSNNQGYLALKARDAEGKFAKA